MKFVSKPGVHFALQVFCETQYTPYLSTRGTLFMTPEDAPVNPIDERRVQAVPALCRGEPVTQVSMQ